MYYISTTKFKTLKFSCIALFFFFFLLYAPLAKAEPQLAPYDVGFTYDQISEYWSTHQIATSTFAQTFVPSVQAIDGFLLGTGNTLYNGEQAKIDFDWYLCKGEITTNDYATLINEYDCTNNEFIVSGTWTKEDYLSNATPHYEYIKFDERLYLTPASYYYFSVFGTNPASSSVASFVRTSGLDVYPDGELYVYPADEDLQFRTVYETDTVSNELYWFFPNNDYVVSNDEWSDWYVYYDMSQYDLDNYERWLLRITYFDSLNNYYLDVDELSTTTELVLWSVERTNDFIDGAVSSMAQIWGTNDCLDLSSPECFWSVLASTDWINWIASSTGYNLIDNPYLIQPGYMPSTSTLTDIFGATSTAEYTFLRSILSPAISAVGGIFPFNIGYNVYTQWQVSETVELPAVFEYFNPFDEDGNVYLPLPVEIYGAAATSGLVFGEDIFTMNADQVTIYSKIKLFSTYLMWYAFIFGMAYRGIRLYYEYTRS